MADADPLTHGDNKTWTSNPPPPRLLTAGFDSLEVAVSIQVSQSWNKVMSRILAEKDSVARRRHQRGMSEDLTLQPITVHRRSSFPRWPVRVSDREVSLCVSPRQFRRDENIDDFPAIVKGIVIIPGELIAEHGLIEAYGVGCHLVERLGGLVVREHVSRVDLFGDFHIPGGLTFDFLREHKVQSARCKCTPIHGYDSKLETFYADDNRKRPSRNDRKRPYLRIYDKTRAITEKPETAWIESYWADDVPPVDIWRVEYEAYRAFLHGRQVHTVLDLYEHAALLWDYYTRKTFSLREKNSKREDRRRMLPMWQSIRAARHMFLAPGARNAFRAKVKTPPNVSKLVTQTYGNIGSYARRHGISDYGTAKRQLLEAVDRYHTEQRFEDKLRR